MGQFGAIIALSNKLLDLINTFFKPSAVTTRHRKKAIAYADLLVESIAEYIKAKDERHRRRAWALVLIRMARYKQIRGTIR